MPGDYRSLLEQVDLPTDEAMIIFVAPPWGTALDEVQGLDWRRTEPPITEMIAQFGQAYLNSQLLFAIQVCEKVNAESLAELRAELDWSSLKVYGFNVAGRNHGILLGTRGWIPQQL
ncbi:hypothetical protein ACQR1W_34095 [Bradyrhizobium sp. HKCCYLS1011]|uniref:hypothetical protein n=1 Tax=Bradyrhizobium sp. HKCCYLS1011 TaxID=3420733 RepID=UPI003EBA2694